MKERQSTIEEAQASATKAIEQVEASNSDWFKLAFTAACLWLHGKQGQEFTTQDMREHLPDAREPRVLGALMRALSRKGIVKATDRYKHSGVKSNHNRPMRVWLVV